MDGLKIFVTYTADAYCTSVFTMHYAFTFTIHKAYAMQSACTMHCTCALYLASCISVLLQIKIKGDTLY